MDKSIVNIRQEIKEERIKLKKLKDNIRKLEENDGEEEETNLEYNHTNSEYKARYENQVEQNRILLKEVELLKKRVEAEKNNFGENSNVGQINKYKGAEGKRLFLSMQREKTNLESQLRDYEWRLDQEATNYHKVNEKIKALLQDKGRLNALVQQSQSQQADKRQSISKNDDSVPDFKANKYAETQPHRNKSRAKPTKKIDKAKTSALNRIPEKIPSDISI